MSGPAELRKPFEKGCFAEKAVGLTIGSKIRYPPVFLETI
jgi:hypothetical protein